MFLNGTLLTECVFTFSLGLHCPIFPFSPHRKSFYVSNDLQATIAVLQVNHGFSNAQQYPDYDMFHRWALNISHSLGMDADYNLEMTSTRKLLRDAKDGSVRNQNLPLLDSIRSSHHIP